LAVPRHPAVSRAGAVPGPARRAHRAGRGTDPGPGAATAGASRHAGAELRIRGRPGLGRAAASGHDQEV